MKDKDLAGALEKMRDAMRLFKREERDDGHAALMAILLGDMSYAIERGWCDKALERTWRQHLAVRKAMQSD